MPVDAQAGQTRWVLKVGLNPGALQGGSGEQYFVGQFDGARFTNDNPSNLTLWTDYGKDCYCALTFNNLPSTQSPVMIGWMSNWQYAADVPTSPWRGQMTVPRKLAFALRRRVSAWCRIQSIPCSNFDIRGRQGATLLSLNLPFRWEMPRKPGGSWSPPMELSR